MVLIEPEDLDRPILDTKYILRVIDENAHSTALILLPAIQFYTGQYFDIQGSLLTPSLKVSSLAGIVPTQQAMLTCDCMIGTSISLPGALTSTSTPDREGWQLCLSMRGMAGWTLNRPHLGRKLSIRGFLAGGEGISKLVS